MISFPTKEGGGGKAKTEGAQKPALPTATSLHLFNPDTEQERKQESGGGRRAFPGAPPSSPLDSESDRHTAPTFSSQAPHSPWRQSSTGAATSLTSLAPTAPLCHSLPCGLWCGRQKREGDHLQKWANKHGFSAHLPQATPSLPQATQFQEAKPLQAGAAGGGNCGGHWSHSRLARRRPHSSPLAPTRCRSYQRGARPVSRRVAAASAFSARKLQKLGSRLSPPALPLPGEPRVPSSSRSPLSKRQKPASRPLCSLPPSSSGAGRRKEESPNTAPLAQAPPVARQHQGSSPSFLPSLPPASPSGCSLRLSPGAPAYPPSSVVPTLLLLSTKACEDTAGSPKSLTGDAQGRQGGREGGIPQRFSEGALSLYLCGKGQVSCQAPRTTS